jgi:hypothetical protein
MSMNDAATWADVKLSPVRGKFTLYWRGQDIGNSGAVHRLEVSSIGHTVGPYAQWTNAVHVCFVPKGARKMREIVETGGSVLILEGWGHPDAPDAYGPEMPGAAAGVSTRRSRHLSCSAEWQREFDGVIAAHTVTTGATVVADYRSHEMIEQSYRRAG